MAAQQSIGLSPNISHSEDVKQFTIVRTPDGSCRLISVYNTSGGLVTKEWLVLEDWWDIPVERRKDCYRLWMKGVLSKKNHGIDIGWRCCGDRTRHHVGEAARYCVLIRNRSSARFTGLVARAVSLPVLTEGPLSFTLVREPGEGPRTQTIARSALALRAAIIGRSALTVTDDPIGAYMSEALGVPVLFIERSNAGGAEEGYSEFRPVTATGEICPAGPEETIVQRIERMIGQNSKITEHGKGN